MRTESGARCLCLEPHPAPVSALLCGLSRTDISCRLRAVVLATHFLQPQGNAGAPSSVSGHDHGQVWKLKLLLHPVGPARRSESPLLAFKVNHMILKTNREEGRRQSCPGSGDNLAEPGLQWPGSKNRPVCSTKARSGGNEYS